ncbi:hypothetical protein MAA_11232 [Metarhizium robertsii ARSEF 23]|uniref:Uncharacterized protein n=1 Tax=Metarhizium robertsii (strain ARSEF 23 / ATCC MYA-3075) TaxID=655844 RepID=A0A0B2XGR7_METRA|nr:uncharacterized protein MAA_11232 [Metarhizium robertsii ARSEF 23]KHO11154.1 hypothetical protein MAA_11232 [Metarhizium robertsii ARSEF 23]
MHQTIDTGSSGLLARSRRYGWTVTSTTATGSPSRCQQPTATLNPLAAPPHSSIVASVISAPLHLCTSAPLPPSNSTRTINSTLAGWSRPIPAAQPAQPAQLFRYSSACFLPVQSGAGWCLRCLPLPWLLGPSAVVVSQHRLA